MAMHLHAKHQEIPSTGFKEKLITDGRTGGQTDRQTDRGMEGRIHGTNL